MFNSFQRIAENVGESQKPRMMDGSQRISVTRNLVALDSQVQGIMKNLEGMWKRPDYFCQHFETRVQSRRNGVR